MSRPASVNPLRHKGFRNLWLAQSISDFGDGLTGLALLIMVNQLTGSTAALATMAIVLAIPQVTLGLVAGVYVDRLERKKIMLVSDSVRALLVLAFVFVDSVEHLWILYVLAFLQSAVGTFFGPARGAVIAQLLPKEALLAANSITQTSRIIAGMLGASAAGVLIGSFKVYWPAFAIDAATFVFSFVLVLLVQVPRLEGSGQAPAGSVLGSLWEGLRTIGRSRILRGTLTGAGVMMLGLGAVNILFIPLLTNDLKVPTTLFGLVQAAQTAGMILAGGMVALLASRLKPTHMVSLGLMGMGLMVGLIAGVGQLWHVLVLLFFIGLLGAPVQAGIGTLVQTSVDDRSRGRVGAALGAVIGSANLVSMALAGVLAGWMGVREVFVVAGILALVAGTAAFWVFGDRAAQTVAGGNK
ncbi:MAG: MFS transporter [Meiothermus sp.]|nr:MFS transporter [Meiothermus sp.]